LLVMDVTDTLSALSSEIEQARARMVALGCQLGFMHPEVLHCSKQLDELLLRFYEIDKMMKQRSCP
jgi:hypothetical protein